MAHLKILRYNTFMDSETQSDSDGDILAIKRADQYRTIDELVEKSQPNSIYYTFLLLSSFIITAGILVNNAAIVIGGMLLTPVLTPILFISLGITSGELKSVQGALYLVAKSALIIIASGIILTFIFGTTNTLFVVDDSARTVALYFLVAVSAGVAGTFAWARKDVLDILPGVAIAVAVVPPLSLIGVGISTLDFSLARFNFLIFTFNTLGIIGGSLVVFSLLQFYKAKQEVHEKIAEVEADREDHERRKEG